ncbi:hypothetical protein ABC345_16935 [Shouchella sp. 1P09AA]|uniref:hypothetical protein n=1 Tax=unclassified Shouchella TaxID=2893065 RepID=UPI00399EFB72
MSYQFEKEKKDFSDFASGRVLYNAPGTTAFPVRLTSEVFQLCQSFLNKKKDLMIYDPCCGGAHMLTAIGFLHGSDISKIYGSDINADIVKIGQKNLDLLTYRGLTEREEKLRSDYLAYQKEAHSDALESVQRFKADLHQVDEKNGKVFPFDITGREAPPLSNINLVITDLPYGELVQWVSEEETPVKQLLTNVYEGLDQSNAIVAIVSEKSVVVDHPRYQRKKMVKHGKRKITILQPI